MNGDLLTDEERHAPMGLGYVMAAERLGLHYLADLKVMTELVCERTNRAVEIWQAAGCSDGQAMLSDLHRWELDQMTAELATILRGAHPRYMAIPWFTDPGQLRASLARAYEEDFGPEDLGPNFDPIIWMAECCVYAPFDMLNWHAADNTLDKFPAEYLTHIRLMVANFLGMPLDSLPPDLVKTEAQIRALRAAEAEEEDELLEDGGARCG